MMRLITDTIFVGPTAPAISGYFTVFTNLEVREYLNACLVALNAIILIMIGRQLIKTFQVFRWEWRSHPGAILMACLWWIFLTDFARACLAWYLLHQQNSGRALTFLTPTVTTLYVIAGAVATAATLRLVYALSPPGWGHRGWVAAMVTTVATVLILSVVVS